MASTATPISSSYAIGYTPGATTAHAGRSATKHAAFLLPQLRPNMSILDVGCGPGSITCDLAELVPQGNVIGVDLSADMIDIATKAAEMSGVRNVKFKVGDVLGKGGLKFQDGGFDVVFCHQLLNHLRDPVGALREMKRLCNPHTGILALREGIMHVWYPDDPRLEEMDLIFNTVMRASGVAQPGAGKYLPAWARGVGFTPERTLFTVQGSPNMGTAWREQIRGFFKDTFGEGASLRAKAQYCGVEDERVQNFYEASMEWCGNEEAFQVLVCGEIVCWMGERV
jgi:SAM-dependent methyltransferase